MSSVNIHWKLNNDSLVVQKEQSLTSTSRNNNITTSVTVRKNCQAFDMIFHANGSCTNQRCKYVKKFNCEIQGIWFQYALEDVRDSSKFIFENFLIRYLICYTDEGMCSCNSYRPCTRSNAVFYSKIERKLITLPKYLVLCLESFYEETERLKKNLQNLQMDIDKIAEINSKKKVFSLIALAFYKNKNHFTLAFRDIKIDNKNHIRWAHYDSIDGNIQECDIDLNLRYLIQINKIPLILVYKISESCREILRCEPSK